ncbi:MAG TPA: carboxypeptidase-like regulatory domain-containing protein, partial [Nitrospirota bacterium]|nr:carboxypeptidase-like regulatory domain-containing protein [Nitrospirota bacterium]
PVTISGADSTGNGFIATEAYSVSGIVTLASPAGPLMGATLTVAGQNLATSVTATTDAGGNYTVTGLLNGGYTVTPSNQPQFDALTHLLTLYTFTPPNQEVTISSANVPGIDFVSMVTTTNAYTVSGSITGGVITAPSGTYILAGVTVVLSSPTSTTSVTTTTDASGNYAFAGVPNGAYTVSVVNFTTGHCPNPILHTFSPVSQSITVGGADLPVSAFAENVSREGCSIPI